MSQWSEMYNQGSATCVDEVEGIALGKTGLGGTGLVNSRMGYWNLVRENTMDGSSNEDAAVDENVKYYSAEE